MYSDSSFEIDLCQELHTKIKICEVARKLIERNCYVEKIEEDLKTLLDVMKSDDNDDDNVNDDDDDDKDEEEKQQGRTRKRKRPTRKKKQTKKKPKKKKKNKKKKSVPDKKFPKAKKLEVLLLDENVAKEFEAPLARPSSRPRRKFCPVTGRLARFTDPETRLPYATMHAFAQIKEKAPRLWG